MVNQLDLEIHNQLVKYLGAEISLDQFRDWFDASTWDVEAVGNRAAQDLAAEVELRLAEYTNGHRTESELRAIFLPLVTLLVYGEPSFGVTSSGNATLSRVVDLGIGADIRVEMVSS